MINPQVKLRVPVTKEDHRQGPKGASLVMVEYGDYECPFCAEAHSMLKQLQQSLSEDLEFVFRNFPLRQIHPSAMNAARAAEAAALQGKFWQMHDALYQHQDTLDPESLLTFAVDLSLNVDRFAEDMLSADVEARILADIESGARSGVNGTPTLFINGSRWEGRMSYAALLGAMQSSRTEAAR